MTERGIYIHIPFCAKICSYCDYFVLSGSDRIESYLNLLIEEINLYSTLHAPTITESIIKSIYIGGGTPSLLSGQQMEKLLRHLSDTFQFSEYIEITAESNPASLDIHKLESYRQSGINRLSIGVQSFNKRELGILTRNHSPKRAAKALTDATTVGFDSVNLDIIFSIPGQTPETLLETLDTALELNTDHFSAYSLIYEPGTKLYQSWKSGKVEKLTDEQDAEFYETVQNHLKSAGMTQYEVSNFCFQGKECRHNLHAWHAGEYFAFGVSSHGYINGNRFSNYRDLGKWSESLNKSQLPISGTETISGSQIIEENIFLPLRADGISKNRFETNTKSTFSDKFDSEAKKWESKGYLDIIENIDNKVYKLTQLGYRFCDTVTFDLISSQID